MTDGQNIDYSEKENGPRASSAPALGLNTIIFKHVYWYMLQISGERLQDHWSSGLILVCVWTGQVLLLGIQIDFSLCTNTVVLPDDVFVLINNKKKCTCNKKDVKNNKA